jgi:sulfatase maturation enzyme AslB (radical SAM superfamily)
VEQFKQQRHRDPKYLSKLDRDRKRQVDNNCCERLWELVLCAGSCLANWELLQVAKEAKDKEKEQKRLVSVL